MNPFTSLFNPSKSLPKASETEEMFLRNAELTFPKECDKRIRKSINEGKHFADCDRLSYQHTKYLHTLGYGVRDQVDVSGFFNRPESQINWLNKK
ncbi:MAG: hypothetical protein H0T62_12465 [Parachlamydiaceae bacterium]|nr:hypothetical protein [Parachlamydiaceae bacterium]